MKMGNTELMSPTKLVTELLIKNQLKNGYKQIKAAPKT